jgi:beta-phosphoglucomutase-like phosphatase (HAD superfamily)
VFGLPGSIRACLFDLDGVLTRTATVHMAAWKRAFDEFLHTHDPAQPEFSQDDYNRFVDGKHRADGVRGFLASRGIRLPEGGPGDPPGAATVHAISATKNAMVLRELDEHGVEVYPGSVRYLRAVKEAGLATAVVTASANGEKVIAAGGFADLIDVRVDGWCRPGLAARQAGPTPSSPAPGPGGARRGRRLRGRAPGGRGRAGASATSSA